MTTTLSLCLYLLIKLHIVNSFCLYTNLDVNSVPIPTGQREKAGCKRNVGAEVGCKQQFRCQQGSTPYSFGYYVEGDKAGNGVQIECVRFKWVLSSDMTSVPRCLKGCPVLTNKEMENSTYIGDKPSNTFYSGAQEFWPLETVVQTSCKDGYIFKNIGHQTMKRDQHRCTTNQGWLDMINKKSFGWPAVCRAICDPLDSRDIPNNVVMVVNATDMQGNVRDYNGRKVLLAGSTYKFQCAPGFNYGYPHERTGFQVLICAGGKEFWYDAETGKNSARPTSCVPSGCPALTNGNTVGNSFFNYDANCTSNGGNVNDGCSAVIRCNAKTSSGNEMGFYMSNNPNGYAMSCRNGKWTRPDGTEAKPNEAGRFGELCTPGCHSLSQDDLQSSTIVQELGQKYNNELVSLYQIGSLLVTSCKNGFIRRNILNQNTNQLTYICHNSGWVNTDNTMNGNGNGYPASCVKGCELPLPTPNGTKIETHWIIVRVGSKSYVYENATVTVSCDENFSPPQSSQNSKTPQNLICAGGSQGWKNEADGQLNSIPMVCVRSGINGCALVNTRTHPNVEIINSTSCIVKEGLNMEGCQLSLRCVRGFIPSLIDGSIDQFGVQNLICGAGAVGYISKTENMHDVLPINCVPSCDVVEEMVTAVYTKPPSNMIIYGGRAYLKSGEEVSIKCKTPDYDINNHADLSTSGEVHYKCFGGDDRYLRLPSYRYNSIPGDACSGVCRDLGGTERTGTLLTGRHKTDYIVHIRDGVRYLVNMEYYVQCASGYKFSEETLAFKLGYQRLLCSNSSYGYMDMDTNETKAELLQCIETTEQLCMKPDGVKWMFEIAEDGSCSHESNVYSFGCVLTLKCMNGTYSTTTTSNTQRIRCAADGNWNNMNALNDPMIKCERGCSNFLTDDNFIVRESSPSIIDSTTFFKQGSQVITECSAGRYPTLSSGVHISENGLFTYVCMPNALDGRSWRNINSQRIEVYPGSLCGKACPALTADGKGVEIVVRPFEFGMSNRLVVGDSVYEFKCKPGHRYDSSVHESSGKQILSCDSRTGSYVDLSFNNKTQASIQVCSIVTGSGCVDITVPNSVITYESCSNGYKDNCVINIRCKLGYIPVEAKHQVSGMQVLSCPNGLQWKEDGENVSTIIQCVPACRMDNTTINPNVIITKDGTKKYVVGGVTYILEGESVNIKCQGDTVVWELDIDSTNKDHLFVCGGGASGVVRLEDHKSSVLIGEGCTNTCTQLPLPNLEGLNVVVKIPSITQYLGKQLVMNGLEYSFSCKENYAYPDSSSSVESGFEKFRCHGQSGAFLNTVTNQVYRSPTSCSRSTSLNECIKLVSDETKVIQTIYQCHDAGNNYYRAGCSISSKCLPSFMPDSDTYYIPSGEQKIICGDGGAGWRDQFGNNITEEFKCVLGCKQYENSHEYIRIHEKTFYIDGLKIECKEIDIIKNQTGIHDHPYYCENNSYNNSTDKGCTNACRQIVTLPAGVEIFKEPQPRQLEEGYPFVAGNSQYVLRCQNGFTYNSTSEYLSLGRQTLQCNPVTNQYDDVDTKVSNAAIEACVKSQGCQVMTVPPNVLETVGSTGCTRTAGFFSVGCSITYGCSPGFYPSDRFALYFGSQTAVCSAYNQTWLDRDGKPFTSITTCSSGCAELNITELVTIQYEPREIFYETFSDSESIDYECFSRSMYTNLIEVVQQVRRNSYICPKSALSNETLISGSQELFCKDACPILSILPEGVKFSQNPIVFNPYSQGTFLGINKTVVLECDSGFEYQAGSVYSTAKKQEFRCDTSLKYFDVQANQFNSVIQPCKQVAGAPAPPGSNVNRTTDVNCLVSNGVYRVGCKLNIKCINGAYPTNPLYFQMAEQNLELIMDPLLGAVWVDSITRLKVNYLSCSIGCLPLSIANLNITTTTATARYGSVTARCQLKTEDLSIGLLPNGTARYFCELQGENTQHNATSPCTNVCEIPDYDKTLTARVVVPMAIPFSQYMVLSSPMNVLCPPGKQWPGLAQAQRGFICYENNEVRDSSTQAVVKHISDTCT